MPNIVRVSPTAVVLRSRSHMYGLTNFPTQTRDTIYVLPVVLFCTIAVASQEVTDIAAKDDDLCYPCLVNGEGICLVWALRCDGIDHCDKGSDEDFDLCYGDSCLAVLPDFRRCDGKKDCRDGRDEYYDGCHDDEATSSSSVFGNASVAVAASFLIGVVVVLLGFIFCICCCCRKSREGRPYISSPGGNKDVTANGYRFVTHSLNYSLDGLYDVNEETV